MSALGAYGLTAVTCVVAEVPGKVNAIHPIPPEIVAEQIRLCFEAFPVRAVKTGMLFSSEILKTVTAVLAELRAHKDPPPLVVDPVMVATSGHRLLNADALEVYRSGLFPRATLITPNLDEAAVLLDRPISDRSQLCEAGRELVREYKVAFLMKGGHLKDDTAADVLLLADGSEHWFEAPFVHGVSTHGTGCTYSAAITAELAKGASLVEAVANAKRYLSNSIQGYLRWQKHSISTDALHHFSRL